MEFFPFREVLVSSAAVIRVVTQRFSPTSPPGSSRNASPPLLVGEKRCVTTLITAAEETREVFHLEENGPLHFVGPYNCA